MRSLKKLLERIMQQHNPAYWRAWVRAASARAGRTAAQVALSIIPASATIATVDWRVMCSTAAVVALASVITSLMGLPEVLGEPKSWFGATASRALRTMAQAAVGWLPAGATIAAVDWRIMLSSVIMAGILSVLTSLAGLPEVESKR